MSTRAKFLRLIFLTLSGFSISLMLFMRTDYAKNEMAYFRDYPYRKIAAHKMTTAQKNSAADRTPILTASLPRQKIREEIIEGPAPFQPETAAAIIRKHASFPPQLLPQPSELPPRLELVPPPSRPPRNLVSAHRSPAPIKQPVRVEDPIKTPKTDWRYTAQLGYEAYRRGDYEMAILYFERALKLAPKNRDIRLQLAYAHKILGHNSPAVENFKTAIDLYGEDAAPFTLRREVEQLENRLELGGYVIYRDETAERRHLTGPDLTQSQAGLELSYQPDDIGFKNGRKFQIYSRFLSSMERDQFKLNPDSYQAGIGLRLKPIADQNLILSVERLVKAGDFARNDWMIRAGYSYDHGTDYREDRTEWWSHSLYLDAALINPAKPDFFLTAQVTSGYNITLAQGLVLQPRLTGLITWQKDSFREASLIEAGPGINMRYYFNDTKYQAYRSYVDVTVEYRVKLSGNSIGSSGPVLGLSVHF